MALILCRHDELNPRRFSPVAAVGYWRQLVEADTYLSGFPLLIKLAGALFPALGSGFQVLRLIGLAVLIFAGQKLAQFGQDCLGRPSCW